MKHLYSGPILYSLLKYEDDWARHDRHETRKYTNDLITFFERKSLLSKLHSTSGESSEQPMRADAITGWVIAKKEDDAAFQLQLCVVFSPDYQGAFEGCNWGGGAGAGGGRARPSRAVATAHHARRCRARNYKWVLRETKREPRAPRHDRPETVDCVAL